MALSQSDLDALDAAIARSELEVELEGRRVRYRSISELIAARGHIATVIAQGTSGNARRRSFQYTFTTQRGE